MNETAPKIDARESLVGTLSWLREQYVKDLSYLSDEQIAACPMGKARTPLNFTAEVGGFNDMVAKYVMGEQPSMPSPEERKAFADSIDTRDKAVALVQRGTDALIAAVKGADESGLAKKITTPWGEETTALEFANMAAGNMMYHCGQINYIQSLYGDAEDHW
jgi:hypothetical protein